MSQSRSMLKELETSGYIKIIPGPENGDVVSVAYIGLPGKPTGTGEDVGVHVGDPATGDVVSGLGLVGDGFVQG